MIRLFFILLALSAGGSTASAQITIASSGAETARLEIRAEALLSMRPLAYRIIPDVADPFAGAIPETLLCELTMPAMAMPDNRTEARDQQGVFVGEMVLTMAGDWRMDCALDGKSYRFEIPGVRMR